MRLQLLLIIAAPLVASSQAPFIYPYDEESIVSPKQTYKLKWPVKKVAVIGAGVGGLIAFRELSKDGYEVHIFERDYLPGGNWHYTDEIPVDAPVPNAHIAIGDYEPSLPPKDAELPHVEEYTNRTFGSFVRRAHRAPKPVWYGLTSNAPAPVQQIREFPWPQNTEWSLPTEKLSRYLRAFASWHGLNTNDNSPNISYNTRVELIEKRVDESRNQVGWTLTTKNVVELSDGVTRVTWNKHNFDGVVMATGRYNAPNIPDIEGLEKWGQHFPEGISHSRQYRRPEKLEGKTVLIVGAATSGVEISREINPFAAKVYQSIRPKSNPNGGTLTLADYIRRLPLNTTLVPEIRRFHPPKSSIKETGIELSNGTVLYGIDHVLFATGYRYTFPFLPEYHDPSLGRDGEVPEDRLQPIITDGSHVRSLHLDVFYIDNPTLAFTNVNFGMQSFTYAEFTSLAISKVWSGKAYLPPREELWKLYRERVKKVGYGKYFQFLGAEGTRNALRFFQGWLNAAAVKYGGRQIDGLPSQLSIITLWTRALFGDPSLSQDRNITLPWPNVNSDELFANDKMTDDMYIQNVVFADDW